MVLVVLTSQTASSVLTGGEATAVVVVVLLSFVRTGSKSSGAACESCITAVVVLLGRLLVGKTFVHTRVRSVLDASSY